MSLQPAIQSLEAKNLRKRPPRFRVGDTLRVHVKIVEGDKERVQVFEGVAIRIHRGGSRASFTVRKVSYGVGVERVFPLHSPRLAKVEIIQRGRVRQARLYYLRERVGKAARIEALDRAAQAKAEALDEVARQAQVTDDVEAAAKAKAAAEKAAAQPEATAPDSTEDKK